MFGVIGIAVLVALMVGGISGAVWLFPFLTDNNFPPA